MQRKKHVKYEQDIDDIKDSLKSKILKHELSNIFYSFLRKSKEF